MASRNRTHGARSSRSEKWDVKGYAGVAYLAGGQAAGKLNKGGDLNRCPGLGDAYRPLLRVVGEPGAGAKEVAVTGDLALSSHGSVVKVTSKASRLCSFRVFFGDRSLMAANRDWISY